MAGLHDGHRRRLMQKAYDNGFEKLEPHEIVEILLFHSIPRGNTNEIAHKLLDKFANLYNICNADVNELTAVEGVGTKTAEFLKMLPTFVRLYDVGVHCKKPYLDTEEKLGKYCVGLLKNLRHEEAHILFLSSRKQLIKRECINKGESTFVMVDYKEIVRSALACNPTYAVLTHNHPTGLAKASNDDVKFTQQLRDYLKNLNIILYEHILVSGDEYVTFSGTTRNVF